MLKRKKPLRAAARLNRFARLSPIAKARRSRLLEYADRKEAYLAAHPWCQITICRQGFDEEQVIRDGGIARKSGFGIRIPRAVDVHHRNKRDGDRLLDERWWMSACRTAHDHVEHNKSWARENGLLLPIQADADGRWGKDQRGATTPELMELAAAVTRET